MLVLTRKSQQQIRVGGEITITVLSVKGKSVRIGIDAPREVRVVRGELPPKDLLITVTDPMTGDETVVAAEASCESSETEPDAETAKENPKRMRTMKEFVAAAAHAL
jgi:carbon storage regulator CsrA